MSKFRVSQVSPPADSEVEEEWSLTTSDPIGGATAYKFPEDSWRIVVEAVDLVRGGGPAEGRLYDGVQQALASVDGVTSVWHEDREQWVAEGTPQGRALLEALWTFLKGFSRDTPQLFEED